MKSSSRGKSLRAQCETKFLKLRELVDAAEFQPERLLIFTEHRDTLEHLQQRFEALGYTGQIAAIHGGMDVEERERQRIFFMPPAERRRQNLPNPDAPGARIMLATEQRVALIPEARRNAWRYHPVAPGDTLASVAQAYRVPVANWPRPTSSTAAKALRVV